MPPLKNAAQERFYLSPTITVARINSLQLILVALLGPWQ